MRTTRQPAPRVWALLALLLLLLVQSASAQMTAEVMVAVSPDWSSWRVVLMLCLAIPMVAAHLVVLPLLFRRRRLYPIANRGSIVILICCLNTLVGIVLNAVMHIAYPLGMPCGMHALNMWLFMPLALALLARGWKLIFRLEIANYLTELAWRQSKIAQLRDSGLFKADNSNYNNNAYGGMTNAGVLGTPTLAPHSAVRMESDGHAQGWALSPNIVARTVSTSATLVRVESGGNAPLTTGATAAAAAAGEGPLAMPTLEPSTIPGHAFITRRWLTEPRWVAVGASAACMGVGLLIALVSVFDADLTFADEWRKARGLPDDGIDSHYADGVFFAGPRCFAQSIKMSSFHWTMLFAIPMAVWCSWRVALSAQRMEARTKEQAEFARALREARGIAGLLLAGTGGDDDPDARRDSHLSTSSSGSGAAPHAPHAKELDELTANKIELFLIGCYGTLGVVFLSVVTLVAYPYAALQCFSTFCAVFLTTCVSALWTSYSVARRHRDLLARARQYGAGAGGAAGAGGKLAPHHAPLYRLKYCMQDEHAYGLLLRFLQKEYSSENALFWHEVRRFAGFCRGLEAAIPGWTSAAEGGAEGSADSDGLAAAGGSSIDRQRSAGSRPAGQLKRALSAASLQRVHGTGSATDAGTLLAAPRSTSPSLHPASADASAVVEMTSSSTVPLFVGRSPGRRATAPVRPSDGADRIGEAQLVAAAQVPAPGSPAAVRRQATLCIRVDRPRSVDPTDSERAGSLHLPGSTTPVQASAAMATATASTSPLPSTRLNSSRTPSPNTTLSPPLGAQPSHAAIKRGSPSQQQQQQQRPVSIRQMHEQAARARAWALQLRADYLRPNAVYQINIPSDLARTVAVQIRQLKAWQPTPLDAAGEADIERAALERSPPLPPPFPLSSLYNSTAHSVFALVESDSFRRFLLTADFESLLARADEAEVERLQRQTDAEHSTDAMLKQAALALEQQQLMQHHHQQRSSMHLTVPHPHSAATSPLLSPSATSSSGPPPIPHNSRAVSLELTPPTRTGLLRASSSIGRSDADGVR